MTKTKSISVILLSLIAVMMCLCSIFVSVLPANAADGDVSYVQLDDCTANWNGVIHETSGQKTGSGMIHGYNNAGTTYLDIWKNSISQTAAGMTTENGTALVLINIFDISKLKSNEGWIELTSSGTNDQNSYKWRMENGLYSKLSTGWNYLELKLSEAEIAGTPDPTALNYARFLLVPTDPDTAQSLEFYIDGLWLYNNTLGNGPLVNITYDKNDDTATGEVAATKAVLGETVILPTSGYSVEGKDFIGWSLTADGDAVTSLTINELQNKTVYALYAEHVDPDHYVVLSACDDMTGWECVVVDNLVFAEGTGSLTISSASESTIIPAFVAENAITVNGLTMENGVLAFWLYVSDADFIDNWSQIALSSGNNRDADSIKWLLKKENFVDGWNYVQLNFADASEKSVTFNPSRIKLFNFIHLFSAGEKIAIDDMIVYNKTLHTPTVKDVYTIVYDGNGATSGNVENKQIFVNNTVDLSVKDYAQSDNKRVIGWSLTSDGEALTEFTLTDDVAANLTDNVLTLYAVWGDAISALQITNADSLWDYNTILNTENKKQGSAAVFMNAYETPSDMFLYFNIGNCSFVETDTSVVMWLYVSDASKLIGNGIDGGWIEIADTEQMDVSGYKWLVSGFKGKLTSGWNRLVLDFKDAIVTGTPNINSLKMMRVLFVCSSGSIEIGVDDVIIYDNVLFNPENAAYTTIVYDGNGATGGAIANEAVLKGGSNVNINKKGYARTGYEFMGWATSADGEVISTLVTTDTDIITLYAVWGPVEQPDDPSLDGNLNYDTEKTGCGSAVNSESALLAVVAVLIACCYIVKVKRIKNN